MIGQSDRLITPGKHSVVKSGTEGAFTKFQSRNAVPADLGHEGRKEGRYDSAVEEGILQGEKGPAQA